MASLPKNPIPFGVVLTSYPCSWILTHSRRGCERWGIISWQRLFPFLHPHFQKSPYFTMTRTSEFMDTRPPSIPTAFYAHLYCTHALPELLPCTLFCLIPVQSSPIFLVLVHVEPSSVVKMLLDFFCKVFVHFSSSILVYILYVHNLFLNFMCNIIGIFY
jgi:hypothetical protein